MLTQLQILNLLLNKKDTSLLSILDSKQFSQYKNEFNFISNHYKQYQQIPDIQSFLKVFPDFEVIQVTESKEYLLKTLNNEYNEEFLAKTFNSIRDLLLKGKTEDAMTVLSKAASKADSSKQFEALDILTDISRYDEYIDKCNNFEDHFVSTGFKELDASFGGGIDRDNAYFVISARPGVGKTLVMIKFITAAVQKGLRVGLYEGEMTANKIAGRFDTMISHISNSAINHGGSHVANKYKTYLEELRKNTKGDFFVLTRDMIREDKMTVDVLRSFVDKYELDMLFVDQISLLDSTSWSSKSFEQVAEISRDLKKLQVQKHIPIVVASQQNRDKIEEGSFAGTQNISMSDRIGQDATEVIYISKKDNIMTFNIAKARDGCKKYTMSYDVNIDKGEFTYIPDEDDLQESNKVFTPSTEFTQDDSFIGDDVYAGF